MKKRFKTHKYKKNIIKKVLLFVIIVLIVVFFTSSILYKQLTTKFSEIEIIDILLKNKEFNNGYFKKNGMDFIVDYALGIKLDNKKDSNKEVINILKNNKIIKDEDVKPLVYIYNTHQTEEYRGINANEYNVIPTVLHASLILKNKLDELGIPTIVETNSIKEILNINGWSYRNSYKASKLLASDTLEKNPSIKYVIDLHRDSVDESIAKVNINNKDYAKIMIVLGEGHAGFENNLNIANRVNNYLKEFNNELSRGIDIKKNSGIYNQDLSNNALLIEVGGPYNDINSVKNTLEVLANVYKRVIDEDEKAKET